MKKFPFKTLLIYFIFIFCTIGKITAQNIIYVNKNVTTSGNGSSWNTAYKELNQALTVASNGKEIWVAKGIYAPIYCTNCNTNAEKDATFSIPDGVKLYGGFVGNETSITQRNFNNNLTILSGNTDPLSKSGNIKSHVYNIVTMVNVGANTKLDGFVLSGARAVKTSTPAGEIGTSGGGVIVEGKTKGNATPNISNCVFYDNYAKGFGGAMFTNGSFDGYAAPTIDNCKFTNNVSEQEGGAINNQGIYKGVANPIFKNCVIENNTTDSASGGGMYNNGVEGICNPIYENCKVINNFAHFYGGGVYSIGKMGKCVPQYTNMLFYKNKSYSGAAIYSLGSLGGDCSPLVTNCVIYGNMANTGGGIYSNASDSTGRARPIITNSIIYNNMAVQAPIFRNIFGTPQFSYSIVNAIDCAGVQSGSGYTTCLDSVYYNIDPKFINPAAGNFHFNDNAAVYNKGTNTTVVATKDLQNHNRINDGKVDIGIYESNNPIKPEILLNPINDTVCKGEKAIFNVSAYGLNLKYKWITNIPYIGVDNLPTFTFDVPDSVLNINYVYCVVSSGADTVYSSMASLKLTGSTYIKNTIIASVPPPYCAGDIVTFTNSKTNISQNNWLLNGVSVGTQSSYQITVPSTNFQIKSSTTATNSCGIVINEEIITDYIVQKLETLTFSIIQNPLPFCSTGSATLKMQIDKPLQINGYEWRADNTIISTNSTIQVTVANISQKITCKLNATGCILNKDNLIANYQMLVFNPSVPSLSFNTNDTICLNKKITYTLRSNFDKNDTISWFYNGIFQKKSNDSMYVINAAKSFDSIRVIVAPNIGSCKLGSTISLKLPMLDICVGDANISNIERYFVDRQDNLQVYFKGQEHIYQVIEYDVLGRILSTEKQDVISDYYTLKLSKTVEGIKFISIKTENGIYDLKIYH